MQLPIVAILFNSNTMTLIMAAVEKLWCENGLEICQLW